MNVQATILNANPDITLRGNPRKKCFSYGPTKVALCALAWVASGACFYFSSYEIMNKIKIEDEDTSGIMTATITMLCGIVLFAIPITFLCTKPREFAVTLNHSDSDYFEYP